MLLLGLMLGTSAQAQTCGLVTLQGAEGEAQAWASSIDASLFDALGNRCDAVERYPAPECSADVACLKVLAKQSELDMLWGGTVKDGNGQAVVTLFVVMQDQSEPLRLIRGAPIEDWPGLVQSWVDGTVGLDDPEPAPVVDAEVAADAEAYNSDPDAFLNELGAMADEPEVVEEIAEAVVEATPIDIGAIDIGDEEAELLDEAVDIVRGSSETDLEKTASHVVFRIYGGPAVWQLPVADTGMALGVHMGKRFMLEFEGGAWLGQKYDVRSPTIRTYMLVPAAIGLSYDPPAHKVRPSIGLDLTGTLFHIDPESGVPTGAIGARAKGSLDLMISKAVGFGVQGYVGAAYAPGIHWRVDPSFKETRPLFGARLGWVVRG